MALTISAAASASSTTSSATLSISSSLVSWSNPDVIVVVVAADNNGTNGVASISSVTDSKGHTYTQRRISNQDPGAAAAGATVAIYTAVATTGFVNGDTITVNFSPNTTSKSMYVWKVSAASTEFVKYVNAGGAVGATANPTVTTVSVTSGDAVIGGLAGETNVNPTADSDTTNGSWGGAVNVVANTGTVATSMHLHTQHKITTGTGTQTWDQTRVAGDWASAYIILDAAARIDRTATGSGAGTDSDGQLVTRPRTATGSGTGSGTASGSVVVVVNRTATGSGTGAASAAGVRVVPRTATGSGAGSQTADRTRSVLRTATGSGTGTQSAARTRSVLRTATGSGTGTQAATGLVTPATPTTQRTATGSGTGSATAVCVATRLRTATGTGSSGFDSFGLITRLRTATGTGTGTSSTTSVGGPSRTATGSGVGTSSVTIATVRVRTAVGSGLGSGSANWGAIVSRFGVDFATGHGQAIGERLFTLEVPSWPRKFPKHFYPPASKPPTKTRALRPPRVRW